MNGRSRDADAGVSSQQCRDQQRTDSEFREEMYKTVTQIRNELARRDGSAGQLRRTVQDFQAQAHHHFSEQEDAKLHAQHLDRAL